MVPDLGQRQPLGSIEWALGLHRSVSPQEYFTKAGKTWDAFWKLARVPTIAPVAEFVTAFPGADASVDASPIERLPAELFDMVLGDTELSTEDLMALGVCSKTLWLQILAHVHEDCRKAAAPWAGTPLLCTGSWLLDLPPAIYEAFPDQQKREDAYKARTGRWYGCCPARKLNWNGISNYVNVEGQSRTQAWLAALTTVARTAQTDRTTMRKLQCSLSEMLQRQTDVSQRNWILRNLTVQQYVRLKFDRPRRTQEANVYVRGASWLTLDRALILRISWGANETGTYDKRADDRLNASLRGSWAGHCFDVAEDSVSLEYSWHDVTDEVVKEAKALKAAKGMSDESGYSW